MRIHKSTLAGGLREDMERPSSVRWRSLADVGAKPWLPVLLELLILLAWTVFVARSYLNFNPRMMPSGSEYPMEVQGHYIWTWFRQCGLCALWDGSTAVDIRPLLISMVACFIRW